MLRKTFVILFLVVFSAELLAQSIEPKPLAFNEFMRLVKKNHPIAKQAELQLELGEAYLQKSRGMFDPQVFSEISQKYFDDKQYYNLNNSGLKIPTWYGLEFGGGYERNEGVFLNPQNNVPNAGLWYAGASLNIGQGLFIDERRAELNKAKIFVKSTQAERQIIYNELLYNAGNTYWEWFNAFHTLKIYEEALSLAEERFEAVKQNAKFGDVPLIDTVEASIQVQNRMLNYQQADLNYKNTTALLSVYLWDEGIIPLEIDENTIPLTLEMVEPLTVSGNLMAQLDSISLTHPELAQYEFRLQQLQLDRRLKQEMIKPKLNLRYNAITAPVGNDAFVDYNTNNYNWGLEFSIPLFLRKERGDLKIAQLIINETKLDFDNKKAAINYKAIAAMNELGTSFNQANLYAKTVKDYLQLLNGEKQKFDAGETSLFMVNARELGYINTQLKYIELIAKNQKARLTTDFALGILSAD